MMSLPMQYATTSDGVRIADLLVAIFFTVSRHLQYPRVSTTPNTPGEKQRYAGTRRDVKFSKGCEVGSRSTRTLRLKHIS